MLSFDNYHAHVDRLIQAALNAVDPETAVSTHLHLQNQILTIANHQFDCAKGNVYFVSVGKASQPMAQAVIDKLGDKLHRGIVIGKEKAVFPFSPAVTTFAASHPVSDQRSVDATTAVYNLLTATTADDLVICLISGGTSALLTKPLIALESWQKLNHALLASGCTINEFNSVRRQLDQVKGGGLAQWAAPAACMSLILSDVVGNSLLDIGSGPTIFSDETSSDALDILERYQIQADETLRVFHSTSLTVAQSKPLGFAANNIIGDVRIAAQATIKAAQKLGFTTQLLTAQLEGEAKEVGKFIAAIGKEMPPQHAIILGGETTVTLQGNGIGGRNLETALAAAIAIEGEPNLAIASFATDGDDGPTKSAGAVVTGESVGNGRLHHLNPTRYLQNNDSYTYFQQLETKIHYPHLLKTGLTGTNVNDLIFILKY